MSKHETETLNRASIDRKEELGEPHYIKTTLVLVDLVFGCSLGDPMNDYIAFEPMSWLIYKGILLIFLQAAMQLHKGSA